MNAYITPASSRGFDPHYDVHDVFVLQIAGEKHWRIHEPVHPDPLRDQPWNDRAAEVAARATEEPAIDEVFRPGDALYLPRGWIHSAEALGGVSVHLTVGVSPYTRNDVVREAVSLAADILALRGSLPLGLDPSDQRTLAPLVGDALDELAAALSDSSTRARIADGVSERLARRQRADSPPAPLRPLSTAAAADSLDVRSVVAVRPGLHPQVTSEVETVTLRLSGKTVALPLAARSALDRLLAGPAVRVGDLPIDDASALVIVRRLLREGVLVTATDERIDIDAGPDPTPFVEA